MKRGSLYWVDLEPARTSEMGKTRPGLIVSNTEHNTRLSSVVVIPLSTQSPEIWPLRLALELPNGKTSFAVIPGIRQVSKTRLHDMIGLTSPSFLKKLDEALGAYLND